MVEKDSRVVNVIMFLYVDYSMEVEMALLIDVMVWSWDILTLLNKNNQFYLQFTSVDFIDVLTIMLTSAVRSKYREWPNQDWDWDIYKSLQPHTTVGCNYLLWSYRINELLHPVKLLMQLPCHFHICAINIQWSTWCDCCIAQEKWLLI